MYEKCYKEFTDVLIFTLPDLLTVYGLCCSWSCVLCFTYLMHCCVLYMLDDAITCLLQSI